MSIIETLKDYYHNATIFFKKYSQDFEVGMDLEKFNKYRLYFINLLLNVNNNNL